MNRRLAAGLRPATSTALHVAPVEAVVALGANLGDRAATLAAAVDELAPAAPRRRRARVGGGRVRGGEARGAGCRTPRPT